MFCLINGGKTRKVCIADIVEEIMEFRYNFVLFCNPLGSDQSFTKLINYDIINREDVRILHGATANLTKLERLAHRFHFYPILNTVLDLPFKGIWNKKYFCDNFRSEKPICFIFDRFPDITFSKTNYYAFLRNKFPKCKLVLMFRDRVEGTSAPYYKEERKRIEQEFDNILVYNYFDAEKFGYTYFPAFESKVPISLEEEARDIDFFYAGAGKDRVKILQDICRVSKKQGLKCFFYIYNVREEERIPIEGITYSREWMPFKDLLAYANRSNCLVDIVQGNAAGFTSRFWHSVFYNKYLISNNPIIKFTKYYNKKYMQVINSAEEINFSSLNFREMPNYSYKDEFSPYNFLRFVDELLSGEVTSNQFYSDWFDITGFSEFLKSRQLS